MNHDFDHNRWRSMKNPLRILVAGALVLLATTAMAGIIFVPVGNRYVTPELALVQSQSDGDGTVHIRTTGLNGELSLDANDIPPGFEGPSQGCARFPFAQALDLLITRSGSGGNAVTEGRSHGTITTQDGVLEYHADVRGHSACVPVNGRPCGQLVVDLELRGTLVDPTDPARVGLLRMDMLGSLERSRGSARWASLTSQARLGGDAVLVSSLTSMTEGESCSV